MERNGLFELTRGHMCITIRRDAHAHIQPWHMALEVRVHIIRVDGMGDIRGDHEAVRGGLGEEVGPVGGAGEGFEDAGDGAGEEVAAGALAEEGADFFVVEEGGEGDDAAVGFPAGGGGVRAGRGGRGGGRRLDESFDGGKGAEFIVDAAGEDEFLVEAAELGGLGVKDFEVPVQDVFIYGPLLALA